MVFILTMLCNHHRHRISRTFRHPHKKPTSICGHSLFLSPPQRLASTHHFQSLDFPILDISHKGNHAMSGLLGLASFTEHNVFKLHPRCRMYPVILFMVGKYSFKIYPGLFIRSSCSGHLGSPLLAIMNKAMSIHVWFLCEHVFSSLGYLPRTGISVIRFLFFFFSRPFSF